MQFTSKNGNLLVTPFPVVNKREKIAPGVVGIARGHLEGLKVLVDDDKGDYPAGTWVYVDAGLSANPWAKTRLTLPGLGEVIILPAGAVAAIGPRPQWDIDRENAEAEAAKKP